MSFNSINNNENKFYIQNQEILGIESIDINYSNSYNVNKILGSSKGVTTVSASPQQKISLSRYLIYNDNLLSYTGNSAIKGSLNYDGRFYGFNSGYLDEYMVNCAVGNIPKVTTNITVYDEMTTGKNAYGTASAPLIYIPRQGNISITCDGSTTNRIVGFDYALKTYRKPIYTIGSKMPSEILSMPIIEYAATVQIDVDDAFLQSGFAFLSNRQNKTLSFSITSRDSLTTLQSLTIPNASLVGESLSSSADGNIKLTLNYIGHL
jgi:hypothetical protein